MTSSLRDVSGGDLNRDNPNRDNLMPKIVLRSRLPLVWLVLLLIAAGSSLRVSWLWGWGQRVLSVAAVVVVILLAYLFLNAATKGYYEWALRVAAVVLLAGGLVLILMVS